MSDVNRNQISEFETDDNESSQVQLPKKSTRNLIGFWFLGLCNNYGYVVMLSAAHDLLNTEFHNERGSNSSLDYNETISNETHYNSISTESLDYNEAISNETHCNSISTGAILLADILPALLIKIVAPFINISIHCQVIIAVKLSALSFILTSFSVAHWMTFIGVICASLSSGLGELIFLSYSSFFDKNVVSTWSSGTGGAGVIGALSYAVLVAWLGARNALLFMLIIPVFMCITFWKLIEHPSSTNLRGVSNLCSSEHEDMLQENVPVSPNVPALKTYTFSEKIALMKMELLYFPNSLELTQADLYRWYLFDYQIGVLISRSSVNFCQINKVWILPILQIINLIFLLLEARYAFIPSIWLVLIIILYEGILGGVAYVNTFYKISSEVPPEDRGFSMGITSLADAVGISLAGAVSLKVHDALCEVISSRLL